MKLQILIFLLGVVASILGYFIANYLIMPIRDYKRAKAKIGRELLYYSHAITSPHNGPLANEAHPVIRRLAVELEERYLLIPLRYIWVKTGIIPNKENVKDAKGSIIRISNSLGEKNSVDLNIRDMITVYTKLDIDELEERNNQKYAKAREFEKLIGRQ